MGYNTAVVFLNDMATEISENRNSITEAIVAHLRSGSGIEVIQGCALALPPVHSTGTQLIAVGGNTAAVLDDFSTSRFQTRGEQVQLLRDWAARLGFRLIEND